MQSHVNSGDLGMSQAAEPASPGGQREVTVEVEALRALLADTSDMAVVLDADGRLGYLNRAGHRLLGLPPEATTDLSAYEVLTGDDRLVLEREVLPALELDGWWTGNLTLVARSGGEVPTRSTLRAHPTT
ncbi:MAG: PAS domain-containing protein, partial [Acidimicrobiales bacterium]